MKTGSILLAIVGGLVLIALLGGGCAYQGYNRVIGLDEQVKTQWAQVETSLQRRFDLIPNLVSTVKGYAKQEEKIFVAVAEARKAYTQAQSVPQKAEAATQLEGALSRLLMIQENYPQLKSNENFLKLQDSLEGTENRISVERVRYNESVKDLNTYRRQFPGTLWASLAGVGEAKYFETPKEARDAPKVDFSDKM